MNIIKRCVALSFAVAALLIGAGCAGNQPVSDPASGPRAHQSAIPVTLSPNAVILHSTIDISAAVKSGKLPSSVADELPDSGLLVKNASITLSKDTTIEDAVMFINRIYSIDMVIENGKLVAIKGVKNGSCGNNSRWTVIIDGKEVTSDLTDTPVGQAKTLDIVFDAGE